MCLRKGSVKSPVIAPFWQKISLMGCSLTRHKPFRAAEHSINHYRADTASILLTNEREAKTRGAKRQSEWKTKCQWRREGGTKEGRRWERRKKKRLCWKFGILSFHLLALWKTMLGPLLYINFQKFTHPLSRKWSVGLYFHVHLCIMDCERNKWFPLSNSGQFNSAWFTMKFDLMQLTIRFCIF